MSCNITVTYIAEASSSDMADDLVHFWWIRGKPIRWCETTQILGGMSQQQQQQQQWWLVPGLGGVQYRPLHEELAAFRAFAELDPNKDDITEFVRKFGVLLNKHSLLVPDGAVPQPAQYGEPLSFWEDETRAMRNAVDVFDALDKPRRLSEWIRLDSPTGDPHRVLFCRGEEGEVPRFAEIANDTFRTSLLGYIVGQPPDIALRRAGQFFVQQEINSRLEKTAAPKLLYDPESDQLELRLMPTNLLGALWLQFARSVEASKNYRRCRVCTQWFEVSVEGKRRHSKYCSDRCRMKAYRDRRSKAVARAAAGESPGLIAEDLGSELDTVLGWIKQPDEGPK